MKFGGTSVADLDRIRNVAQRVKREVDAGNQVAVVVSAMSGVTNQLVKYRTDLSPLHDAREYDAVVATGEQVTSGLRAIELQRLGHPASPSSGLHDPMKTTTPARDRYRSAYRRIRRAARAKSIRSWTRPMISTTPSAATRYTTICRGRPTRSMGCVKCRPSRSAKARTPGTPSTGAAPSVSGAEPTISNTASIKRWYRSDASTPHSAALWSRMRSISSSAPASSR